MQAARWVRNLRDRIALKSILQDGNSHHPGSWPVAIPIQGVQIMTFRQSTLAGTAALLLATCTSCRLQDFDLNGDGVVTKAELLSAAFDTVCGDPADDNTTDDGTTGDGTTDEGTDSGTTDDGTTKSSATAN